MSARHVSHFPQLTHRPALSFCLNLGWLYTRLVAHNSFAAESAEESDEEDGATLDERSSLITKRQKRARKEFETKLGNSIQEFMAMCVPGHLSLSMVPSILIYAYFS